MLSFQAVLPYVCVFVIGKNVCSNYNTAWNSSSLQDRCSSPTIHHTKVTYLHTAPLSHLKNGHEGRVKFIIAFTITTIVMSTNMGILYASRKVQIQLIIFEKRLSIVSSFQMVMWNAKNQHICWNLSMYRLWKHYGHICISGHLSKQTKTHGILEHQWLLLCTHM